MTSPTIKILINDTTYVVAVAPPEDESTPLTSTQVVASYNLLRQTMDKLLNTKHARDLCLEYWNECIAPEVEKGTIVVWEQLHIDTLVPDFIKWLFYIEQPKHLDDEENNNG